MAPRYGPRPWPPILEDGGIELKTAIIAARVSSDDPDGERLDDQLGECREWAVANDYEVSETVVLENGISGGRPISERPAVDQALAALRAGKVQAVVWREIDRMGRRFDTAEIIEEHQRYQDGVIFVRQPRADDPIAEILRLGMGGVLARWERQMISERTARGRRRSINEGSYGGGGYPFWLAWSEETGWAARDETVPLLREIIALYLGGTSTEHIARELTGPIPSELSNHWRSRTGRGWQGDTVLAIIKNPALAGRLYCQSPVARPGRRQRQAERRQHLRTIIDSATLEEADDVAREVGLVPVEVPAIIGWEDFARMQEIRRGNYRAPHRRKVEWLLQGRIKCGLCGHTFSPTFGHDRRDSFRCRGVQKRVYRLDPTGTKCPGPRIEYEWITGKVAERLDNLATSPEAVRQAADEFLAGLTTQIDQLGAGLAPVNDRLAAIEEKKRRWKRLWAEGDATDEEWKAEKEKLDRDRDKLLRRQVDSTSERIRLQAVQDLAADIRDSLMLIDEDVAEEGDAASILRLALGGSLRERIERLDVKLVVYEDRIEMQAALPLGGPFDIDRRSVRSPTWRRRAIASSRRTPARATARSTSSRSATASSPSSK